MTGESELHVSRRAANKQRLNQRLLEAVERALAGEGDTTFAELSIECLLHESQVARSTFYYHYADKNALLCALAEGVIEEFEASAMSWWKPMQPATKQGLADATEQMFEIYWRHRTVMAAAVEIAAGDAAMRSRFNRMWTNVVDEVTARIAEAQRNHRARNVDPARTAAFLVWMTERGLYQLSRHADRAEITRLAAVHADISWTTLFGD